MPSTTTTQDTDEDKEFSEKCCRYCGWSMLLMLAITGSVLVGGFWQTDATHTYFSTSVCAKIIDSTDTYGCKMISKETGKQYPAIALYYPDGDEKIICQPGCIDNMYRTSMSDCPNTNGFRAWLLNSYPRQNAECTVGPLVPIGFGFAILSILIISVGCIARVYIENRIKPRIQPQLPQQTVIVDMSDVDIHKPRNNE
jgi:hypothetical protein